MRINNTTVKAAKEVKLGDEIQITRHTATYTYRVIQLLKNRVGARLVNDYIIDITPVEELEKYKMYQSAQSTYRQHGSGKPTKKDRRDLDDFMDDWD
ncbi:MAG: RNA-binding S4 domain-containing protein [Crocinitomicaceae bacterium]|nr:RNA-binding S4 domain-containing protein [Crocinitomicaceae bacterium]